MQNPRRFLIPVMSLFLIFSFQIHAFSQGPHMERIKAQRVAFFTEKLDLSESEAEKFWPVYNDYSSQKEKINLESRNLTRSLMLKIDDMEEKEIEVSLHKFIELENNSNKLFLKYNEKFNQILPPSKVMKLYMAENQFKQYLLKQIGDQRKPGMGRNR